MWFWHTHPLQLLGIYVRMILCPVHLKNVIVKIACTKIIQMKESQPHELVHYMTKGSEQKVN